MIGRRTWIGKHVIKEALDSFFRCIKPGGVLYVDTTAAENLTAISDEVREYDERLIEGRRVKLQETVSTNIKQGTRLWKATLSVDGTPFLFERKSVFLPHTELMQMLHDVGFAKISKPQINGEHYAVFVGHR